MDYYAEANIPENVNRVGAVLKAKLEAMRAAHPSVGDVRSIGLFAAVELVKDKETREALVPYGKDPEGVMKSILGKLFAKGFMTYTHENMILVAPPLIIAIEQLEEELQKLDEVLSRSGPNDLTEARMAYSLKLPGRTWFGEGALEAADGELRSLGKRALIITGKVVVQSEAFARLTRLLDASGTGWTAFTGIPGEPDDGMIEEGAKAYSENQCDFLIGLGGGSPLDSAQGRRSQGGAAGQGHIPRGTGDRG